MTTQEVIDKVCRKCLIREYCEANFECKCHAYYSAIHKNKLF